MTDLLLFKDIDEPGLATIDVYERRGGYGALRKALQIPVGTLIASFKDSGLRGRGGAGFSMGTKASFIPQGAMQKYVVVNADESEPGTFKDKMLIDRDPHALIEGILISGYAIKAKCAYIYIRGEFVTGARIL